MYRARDIFLVEKAVVVTQEFHLLRALYIGQELGLDVYGVASDPRAYSGADYYRLR
jgi:vancomycin permeability regulator SanA